MSVLSLIEQVKLLRNIANSLQTIIDVETRTRKQFTFNDGGLHGFLTFNNGPQSLVDQTSSSGLQIQISDSSGNPTSFDAGFYTHMLETVLLPGDYVSFNFRSVNGTNNGYTAKIILYPSADEVEIVVPASNNQTHTLAFVVNEIVVTNQAVFQFIGGMNGLDAYQFRINQVDFSIHSGVA